MLSKKISDIKANKLYWEFHSAFIKIKSCKSVDFSPNVFFHEEKEYEDPVELGSVFNTFSLVSHKSHSPMSSNATNMLIKLLPD